MDLIFGCRGQQFCVLIMVGRAKEKLNFIWMGIPNFLQFAGQEQRIIFVALLISILRGKMPLAYP